MNLELGSNAPLIVHCDGDWELAADKASCSLLPRRAKLHLDPAGAVDEDVADAFTERLIANTKTLRVATRSIPRPTSAR